MIGRLLLLPLTSYSTDNSYVYHSYDQIKQFTYMIYRQLQMKLPFNLKKACDVIYSHIIVTFTDIQNQYHLLSPSTEQVDKINPSS